jgi:hypothetical protein
MKKNQLLKLLKSGNFTVAYHDNGYCTIYKGRHEYEDLPDKEVYEPDDLDEIGYAPAIVTLLVEALGGSVDSV